MLSSPGLQLVAQLKFNGKTGLMRLCLEKAIVVEADLTPGQSIFAATDMLGPLRCYGDDALLSRRAGQTPAAI